MKKTSISTLILVLLAVLSCEENATPDPTIELPKLTRMDNTDGSSNTISTYYEYQGNLLTKKTAGPFETVYTYEGQTLVSEESYAAGQLMFKKEYTKESEDKLVQTMYRPDGGNLALSQEWESLQLSETEIRLNAYNYSSGQKVLNHYRIMTVADGNLLREESFNADGTSQNIVVTYQYHEGVNPLKFVLGEVDFNIHFFNYSKNLVSASSLSLSGNLSEETSYTIELNEFQLPEKMTTTLTRNGMAITNTYLYYYE
ncbi:MAG: hypothetical protein HEP71_32100 [Roseivirga sp.]|nr:hypothetical protein [Roseivirga sp.]